MAEALRELPWVAPQGTGKPLPASHATCSHIGPGQARPACSSRIAPSGAGAACWIASGRLAILLSSPLLLIPLSLPDRFSLNAGARLPPGSGPPLPLSALSVPAVALPAPATTLSSPTTWLSRLRMAISSRTRIHLRPSSLHSSLLDILSARPSPTQSPLPSPCPPPTQYRAAASLLLCASLTAFST